MLAKATIGRLPEYLRYLRRMPAKTSFVSATAVAKGLSLGEVQVRKDFAMICGKGKPRTGYRVLDLITAMEGSLGMHAKCEAVIVGAGRLGKTLLEFRGFDAYGVTVRYAFDIAPDAFCDNVQPIGNLAAYCAAHQVEIGIITVPTEAAQEAAELLLHCGVRAIWCFAVCRLTVPDDVTVQYENLALSLAHLKSRIESAPDRGNPKDVASVAGAPDKGARLTGGRASAGERIANSLVNTVDIHKEAAQ